MKQKPKNGKKKLSPDSPFRPRSRPSLAWCDVYLCLLDQTFRSFIHSSNVRSFNHISFLFVSFRFFFIHFMIDVRKWHFGAKGGRGRRREEGGHTTLPGHLEFSVWSSNIDSGLRIFFIKRCSTWQIIHDCC